ncbi:hypothetical protein D3C86_1885440 [compost metagenome]
MTADGAGIRIGGGKVDIYGPGGILLHTSDFDIVGPSSLNGPLPQFSQGDAGRKFLLKAGELERPVPNAPYQIVKADGSVVEGVTNAAGETAQSASDLIEAVSVKIFAPKLY